MITRRFGMKTTDDSGQTVQRVKVAMTGLALVLLLIGLASVIFSSASTQAPDDAADAVQADLVANLALTNESGAVDATPNEPLAELGVAPSTTTPAPPANTAAAAPQPAQPSR